jgi:predicted secreted protein
MQAFAFVRSYHPNIMQKYIFTNLIAAGALLIGGSALFCNKLLYAQTPPFAAPALQQVNLSAQAHMQAMPDWLTVVLSVQREGPEPQALQTQVQKALDAALQQAKNHASSANKNDFELKTGAFQMQPRYGANGRINGWMGQAELVLQGRDIARITHTAAQLNTMVVQSLHFTLAPETRQQLETQLQTQAIAQFQARAQQIAQAFGYRTYALGQIQVGTLDTGQAIPLASKVFSRAAAAEMAAPIPTEPGTNNLQLTVHGTVILQK